MSKAYGSAEGCGGCRGSDKVVDDGEENVGFLWAHSEVGGDVRSKRPSQASE